MSLLRAREDIETGAVLIRRELPADHEVIRAVHCDAFRVTGNPDSTPPEATLVGELRRSSAWMPTLSLVAIDDDTVVGHVVCSRGHIERQSALGLAPIGVLPGHQRRGFGKALMHAVLGAADALGEPLVALLGSPDYYSKFGFERASKYGISPPLTEWEPAFQVRPLTAYDPSMRGTFQYAAPFDAL